MGNRGIQAALVVVVLVFGVLAALIVGNARKGQVANTNPTPTASTSATESPSPSPSPSASPSPEASPSIAPSESPSAAPAPTATTQPAQSTQPAPTGGPAAYPSQIRAGSTWSYSGPRALVVHATDSRDSGNSVCAGINESTQDFPTGYEGVFFVGIQFADGNILSAGYIRSNGSRRDFASFQNASGSTRQGTQGTVDPGAGSHTYCVTHAASANAWIMTRDGNQLFATASEAATDVAGATVKFDSDVQTLGSPPAASFTFVVPGFHDISIGGQPPHQLRGATFYS